jgi:lysophospholipase L1-like esterase
MDIRTGPLGSLALCLILAACGGGGSGASSQTPVVTASYATWSASPQVVNEAPPGTPGPPPTVFSDQTVRQIAHISAGGTALKVRLSNLFGPGPVTFTSVRIAKSLGASAIDPSTDHAVTFAGAASVTVPEGAELWSDDVALPVARAADVTVSIYVAAQSPVETGHTSANSTIYIAAGNSVSAPSFASASTRVSLYWLSALAASSEQKTNVVVAFGDSITEGSGSTLEGNMRYPDQLSSRLAGETAPAICVVNAGIGGNRWVFDFPGPSGASRFDRDVLGVQGVTHAIVLLGINDLEVAHTIPSQAVTVQQLIDATQAAVSKAKAKGVKVLLGTLLPYKGSALYDPADEAVREAYNAWVRSQTVADGVVDFEAALRDPLDPLAIAPQFASPDHIHPNDAGYGAMAAAVDITKLR